MIIRYTGLNHTGDVAIVSEGYSNTSFDIEKAIDIAACFAMATQVNVSLIDNGGRLLYYSEQTKSECEFCTRIKQLLHFDVDCSAVRLYGAYQAERFGGSYIFYCPLGLAHFASPITIAGEFCGAYIGGPVLPSEPSDYLAYEMHSKFGLDKQTDQKTITEALGFVTYVTPTRLRRLSEMLTLSAAHLCGAEEYCKQQAHSLSIQSEISEYIQSIKIAGEAVAYPIKTERKLLDAIAAGNRALAGELLNEILGHIYFSSGGAFEVICSRIMELVVLLSRAAVDGGADPEQIFGLNYKYLAEVYSFHNIEDLSVWLTRIMSRFTDCVFNLTHVKHADVMYKAVGYIKQNFMHKLTLEEVSDYIFLSPSYFSKVFAEEMGETFNSYLNRIRIENAKRLLLQDEIKTVDISNMVGYEDQSYFSKVFKKLVGVSPGDYRKSRGKVKSAF